MSNARTVVVTGSASGMGAATRRILEAGGEAVHEIGHVRARAAGEEGCVVRGAEKAWPGA